jgi:hypothetical protein
LGIHCVEFFDRYGVGLDLSVPGIPALDNPV